jgi:regulator of sigma E protease
MSTVFLVIGLILIIALLILVHEFGHFWVAKRNGIRVDEFGFGFPPRIKKLFTWKGTDFTVNWIPFGGFVKIFGENPDDPALMGKKPKESFVSKSRRVQAKVLLAGIFYNLLFAWLLFFVAYMVGVPTIVGGESSLTKHLKSFDGVVITQVLPESPAAGAGLLPGDTVLNINKRGEDRPYPNLDAYSFAGFVESHPSEPLSIDYEREGRENSVIVTPRRGVVSQDYASIGVAVGQQGTLRLPVHKALWHGLKSTVSIFGRTVTGLVDIIGGIFQSESNTLDQVSGPVGIAGVVKDASVYGFAAVVFLIGVISVNLAVLNLIPFPALDGGRLFILIIEGAIRKPLSPKIVGWINGIGFLVLIALMIAVTVSDIIKL